MLTVTKLEPQKKNPQRLNVYLNGEFAFGISRAAAPWLDEGNQLSQSEIDELQFRDGVESAYQRALNFLSYRSRSEQEIRQNLQKAQISEEVMEAVLDRLRHSRLVDDRQFAKEWVENRSRFKPRGKKALSSELIQKGISSQLIVEVLENVDEPELALRLARKKLPRLHNLERTSFQEKLYGYLSRRGFSDEVSRETISRLWEERELE
jgi:regulatory protein